MSTTSLQRFYNTNGIKFRDAKMRFKHYLQKKPHLDMQRKKMAVLLGSL